MNDPRAYQTLSATIFAIVGLAHIARAVMALPISIGDVAMPVALSWPVGIAALALAAWGISQRRAAG